MKDSEIPNPQVNSYSLKNANAQFNKKGWVNTQST